MKSTSVAAGAMSGCLTWVILITVLCTCLIPVGFVFALFTETTDLAAGVVGPLVCPAGSTATIESTPTTFPGEGGVEIQGIGTEMVCVDSNGTVVARPAPLPNWIWTAIVLISALLVSAILSLVFAAPAGALIAGLTNRIKKK